MSGRYGSVPKHYEMTYYVKTKARAKQKLDFVSLNKVQLKPYGKEHKNSK